MDQQTLAPWPSCGFNVGGKGHMYGKYSSLGPQALSFLAHSVLKDSLHQAMHAQRLAFPITAYQGKPQEFCDCFIPLKYVGSNGLKEWRKMGRTFPNEFLRDGIRS